MAPYYDPENAASSYTLLSDQPHPAGNRRPFRVLAGVFVTAVCLVLVLLLVPAKVQNPSLVSPETLEAPSRGVSQGVSEKAFRQGGSGSKVGYPWTNSMLSWQRTSYHFQPEKNWMNDPNGRRLYVVFVGRRPGIYDTWEECHSNVNRYPGAVYRAFNGVEEAQEAWMRFHGDCSAGSVVAGGDTGVFEQNTNNFTSVMALFMVAGMIAGYILASNT